MAKTLMLVAAILKSKIGSFHYVTITIIDLLDPENMALDTRITLLSCLGAEIWLIL